MTPLRRMLEARSVAVVGASSRPGSVGETMLDQLVGGGFDGALFPVNPNYQEVAGRTCYPSLEALDTDVDLVLLGVPNAALEEQLSSAAAAGVPAAVIFASATEDPPREPTLATRLATIVNDAGMVVCGPNGMGFVNVDRRLRALAFAERDLPPGPITFLTHSGSVFTAMLHNFRGLRFNLAVSSGQEMTTTIAEYVDYSLDQPTTGVIAMFIETIRDPGGFVAAVKRASERDIPVVALKVGVESKAREFVTAHSGALAGEDGAYEALFETYGVMRVRTLAEMADTLELMSSGRRATRGGLAAIHDSGGERAHLIDMAADAGVPFADVSRTTLDRLAENLDPGLPPSNPLDAWGTGNNHDEQYEKLIRILLDDPDTGAFAFVVDLAGEETDPSYSGIAERIGASTDKPFAVLSNLSSAISPETSTHLRSLGVPVLEGTSTGLSAFRHLFALRDFGSLPPLQDQPRPSDEVRDRWRARLAGDEPWTEAEGLTLLKDYGIPVTESIPCRSAEEVTAAGEALGYPVVLKSAAEGLAHKSDSGGVVLGLGNAMNLLGAYAEMSGRLGPEVLVAKQVTGGVELALGIVHDTQFGPLVLVGAGGVLTELLRDRRMALPPLDQVRAERLLEGLKARPLLDGFRGSAPADLRAVADAIVRLSVLAADLGDTIAALDVNPLICTPEGCVAVDALVLAASERAEP